MGMQSVVVEPYEAASAWMVTPSSYLMDRIVPDCEQILLPAKREAGGHLTYGRGPLTENGGDGGRLTRLRRTVLRKTAVDHDMVYDMRRHSPQNWAHFINQHLPLFFRVCGLMELEPNKALLVVPENTPGYIQAAAEVFELTLLRTDSQLEGDGILSDLTPWMAVRAAQADWVRTPYVTRALARVDALGDDFPENVFLSRRDTRNIENEDQVADWLAARGFEKIYPEDLSAAQQLRLFRHARRIVAVHGAGQAPLLYAHPGGRLEQMVEILPCGHMTDVYRVMAHQIGCKWIGVRGKLKPQYVQPAYNTQGIFKQFSLDSFEVDLTSLARAFEIAEL